MARTRQSMHPYRNNPYRVDGAGALHMAPVSGVDEGMGEFLSQYMKEKQNKFDATVQLANKSIDQFSQLPSYAQDIDKKQELVGGFTENVNNLVKEKYGNDWTKAANEVTGLISNFRNENAEFLQFTKENKERAAQAQARAAKLREANKLANPQMVEQQFAQSTIDPETGQVRQLSFDPVERTDYGKWVQDNIVRGIDKLITQSDWVEPDGEIAGYFKKGNYQQGMRVLAEKRPDLLDTYFSDEIVDNFMNQTSWIQDEAIPEEIKGDRRKTKEYLKSIAGGRASNVKKFTKTPGGSVPNESSGGTSAIPTSRTIEVDELGHAGGSNKDDIMDVLDGIEENKDLTEEQQEALDKRNVAISRIIASEDTDVDPTAMQTSEDEYVNSNLSKDYGMEQEKILKMSEILNRDAFERAGDFFESDYAYGLNSYSTANSLRDFNADLLVEEGVVDNIEQGRELLEKRKSLNKKYRKNRKKLEEEVTDMEVINNSANFAVKDFAGEAGTEKTNMSEHLLGILEGQTPEGAFEFLSGNLVENGKQSKYYNEGKYEEGPDGGRGVSGGKVLANIRSEINDGNIEEDDIKLVYDDKNQVYGVKINSEELIPRWTLGNKDKEAWTILKLKKGKAGENTIATDAAKTIAATTGDFDTYLNQRYAEDVEDITTDLKAYGGQAVYKSGNKEYHITMQRDGGMLAEPMTGEGKSIKVPSVNSLSSLVDAMHGGKGFDEILDKTQSMYNTKKDKQKAAAHLQAIHNKTFSN